MWRYIELLFVVGLLLLLADDFREGGIFPDDFYCKVDAGVVRNDPSFGSNAGGWRCHHNSLLTGLFIILGNRPLYKVTYDFNRAPFGAWGLFNILLSGK